MDNLSDNQTEPAKPDVIFARKNFFQTKKGISILATSLAVVIFLGLTFALNYTDIISIPNLGFLPKKTKTILTGTPVQITLLPENYGFQAGELTLSCPVESAFCESQQLTSLGKNPAVGYQGAFQSSVLNLVKVESLENIGVLTNQQTGKKYFYESIVSKNGDSCYTIAYTLPSDATFGDILSLPLVDKNTPIATLGEQKFQISGQQFSVVIQVRNTPMDPGIPCSLIRKSPEFFKAFD